jgi:cobalt-zinc-cadmium efflux system protein
LLVGSGRLLKSGVHILMEGVPEGVDLPEVGRAMGAVPGVRDVHDLHIWSLCPGAVALSAHVTADGNHWNQASQVQAALKDVLRDRFQIEHTTIQLECTQCPQGVVSCVDDRPER